MTTNGFKSNTITSSDNEINGVIPIIFPWHDELGIFKASIAYQDILDSSAAEIQEQIRAVLTAKAARYIRASSICMAARSCMYSCMS